MKSDISLVQKARMGDENAKRMLYLNTIRRNWFAASQIFLAEKDTRIIVRDAYVIGFDKIHYLKADSAFDVWMDHILMSVGITILRKCGYSVEKLMGNAAPEASLLSGSLAVTTENCRKVTEAWKKMPWNLKLILMMHYHEKMSIEDLASQFVTDAATIYGWINLSLSTLILLTGQDSSGSPISRCLETVLMEQQNQVPVSAELLETLWTSIFPEKKENVKETHSKEDPVPVPVKQATDIMTEDTDEPIAEETPYREVTPERSVDRKRAASAVRRKRPVRRKAGLIAAAAVVAVITGVSLFGLLPKKDAVTPVTHVPRIKEQLTAVASPRESKEVTDADVIGFAEALAEQVSGQLGGIVREDGKYKVSIEVQGRTPSAEIEGEETLTTPDTVSESQSQKLNATQPVNLEITTQVITRTPSYMKMSLHDYTTDCYYRKTQVLTGPITGETSSTAVQKTSYLTQDVTYSPDADVVLAIRCTNVDMNSPLQMMIDSAMVESIGDGGMVQVFLNDEQHGFRVEASALKNITDRYGSVSVRYEILDGNSCNLTFTAPDGTILKELPDHVELILPGTEVEVSSEEPEIAGTATVTYDDQTGTTRVSMISSGSYTFTGVSPLISMEKPAQESNLPAGVPGWMKPVAALNTTTIVIRIIKQLTLFVFLFNLACWSHKNNRKEYFPPGDYRARHGPWP